ncbi:hypothetical protein, partial [Staphylococcus aureus]|uniref:hypothetical protein n=1 Tax=Staphylococcus aureus TaxID=1280 RepID=UPI002043AC9B
MREVEFCINFSRLIEYQLEVKYRFKVSVSNELWESISVLDNDFKLHCLIIVSESNENYRSNGPLA